MKTKLLALAVSAAVVSFSANAAVEDTWSLGASAGWSHVFDSGLGNSYDGVNTEVSDKNGYGFKLNGEYNFTDWFALGLGYDYLNGSKIKASNFAHFYSEDAKLHSNTISAYGRFALPLDTNGSDVFFKVGPTWNRSTVGGQDFTQWGAVIGLGGQWALNESVAIRAGYDYLYRTLHSNNDGARLSNGLLYVGVQYTFGAPAPVAPAPVAAPVEKKTVRVTEDHSLAAGLLFPFDGSTLSTQGKKAISDVVASSKNLQNTEFEVYGYTDRIGSDAYNQKLSQKRADAVTSELQAEGVNTVKASEGRGKASPVTGNKCDSVKGRQAVIDCLAPDRRVEIVVTGDTVKEEQE